MRGLRHMLSMKMQEPLRMMNMPGQQFRKQSKMRQALRKLERLRMTSMKTRQRREQSKSKRLAGMLKCCDTLTSYDRKADQHQHAEQR